MIRRLDPDLALMDVVLPYLQQTVAKRYDPSNLLKESVAGLVGLGQTLQSLPPLVDQFVHDAQRGQIAIQVQGSSLDVLGTALQNAGARQSLVAFAMTSGLGGALLVQGERYQGWGDTALRMSLAAWVVLALSHLFGNRKPMRAATFTQFFRR
jgi:predicted unusual protein kinase regulating ubiquinone biosynthesis (AarF/ABC1/UbiB family)